MSLKTRAITAVFFVGFMVAGTIAHAYSCIALLSLVAFLCLFELSGLVLAKDGKPAFVPLRRFMMVLVGCMPLLVSLLPLFVKGGGTTLIDPLLGFSGGLVLLASLFLVELFGASSKPFENVGYSFIGLIYIGVPFMLLITLVAALTFSGPTGEPTRNGSFFILGMLFMIWVSDSGAYLVGSKFGKHKMFPRISPKKTWEGTMGGVVASMIVGYLCSLLFASVGFPWWNWLVMAAICAFFGVLGDLVESMLKRSLGIKDSGNILPGHGGFLDRFDSFIFVTPFLVFAVFLMQG